MHTVLERISHIGIVPVIAIQDAQQAVPLARALLAGGIPCAEITFRTAQGEEAIRRIAAKVPEILLGAGTVLTVEQVDRAIAAGASFIVSPGFNPAVVRHCIDRGIPVTPGCACPSDMERALEHGLEVVKFFPAEQAGGLAYIKAVSAPYPSLRFMPTGGIHAGNLAHYLENEKVLACGGSWMVPQALINAGSFDEITRLCREAVHVSLGFSLAHIGINCAQEAEALGTAALIGSWFGFDVKNGNHSLFAGTGFELMKAPGRGEKGHIALFTSSLPRAIAYLTRQGAAIAEDSIQTNAAGKPTIAYLQDEIAGFALHLIQK